MINHIENKLIGKIMTNPDTYNNNEISTIFEDSPETTKHFGMMADDIIRAVRDTNMTSPTSIADIRGRIMGSLLTVFRMGTVYTSGVIREMLGDNSSIAIDGETKSPLIAYINGDVDDRNVIKNSSIDKNIKERKNTVSHIIKELDL